MQHIGFGVQKLNPTKIVLTLFASGWLLACGGTVAMGQTPAKPVAEIRIEGQNTLTDTYIRQQLKQIRVGQPAESADIQKDVDNLKQTGKFSDVFATTEPLDDGIAVIFHVKEKPLVHSIRFLGAKEIKEKNLVSLLQFKVDDPLDKYKIQTGSDAIAEKYQSEGYSDAAVSVDEQPLESGDVVYLITEGPRVRINKVQFEGSHSFSRTILDGQVQTKTYLWLLRKGAYSEKQIQDDIVSLRTFYRRHGFLDAQVGRRLDYSSDRRHLTVTFVIEEGLHYTVANVKVEGNAHFTVDQILNTMKLAPGNVLNLDRLEADSQAILDKYHAAGFIYADVNITHIYAETSGTVNLNVEIKEATSYQIGRITIRGNARTQDRVIRRTLDFCPEETFDLVKMKKRENRLKETRLFREVTISPTGEGEATRDALIEVEESETSWIMAGIGVSSNSGVLGNISIENWNFDLFDWPRSWGEFFRGQAFKGAGQTLRLSLQPGTEMSQVRLDFTEPYLFDLPISLGWSGYIFERNRDGYKERRAGMIASLGKRFAEIYSLQGAFRFEGIDVRDIDDYWLLWPFLKVAPQDILDVEGSNFLTSFKLSLVRDTTDSFFMPTQGTRMETSWEQAGLFGGDFDFSKLIGQVTHYKTLRTDTFDRKTVWASNVELGYIGGDVPVFERFYGGGIGSIRGFEYRGISPRQDPSATAVGGRFETFIGNEVSFPLVGKSLRGVTFLDMGTVEEDVGVTEWRAAAGLGIRLTIDYFGPIPMAFDFAWPISTGGDDDTQVFSFSLGAMFK